MPSLQILSSTKQSCGNGVSVILGIYIFTSTVFYKTHKFAFTSIEKRKIFTPDSNVVALDAIATIPKGNATTHDPKFFFQINSNKRSNAAALTRVTAIICFHSKPKFGEPIGTQTL